MSAVGLEVAHGEFARLCSFVRADLTELERGLEITTRRKALEADSKPDKAAKLTLSDEQSGMIAIRDMICARIQDGSLEVSNVGDDELATFTSTEGEKLRFYRPRGTALIKMDQFAPTAKMARVAAAMTEVCKIDEGAIADLEVDDFGLISVMFALFFQSR